MNKTYMTKKIKAELLEIAVNHLTHALSLIEETEVDDDDMNQIYYSLEDAKSEILIYSNRLTQ